MQKDYTHLIIVLDASGSMSSIQDDIKGSFNEFLKKQREAEGQTVFDLFQFNDEVKRPVKTADLAQFHDDLMAKYDCSGCTALNDAVCTAIDTMGKEFAAMPEEERPENVLCVIITDGMENASKEFTTADVKKRIEHQQNVYQWKFIFLAANQDAFAEGEKFGVAPGGRVNFTQNSQGVACMSRIMYEAASDLRGRKRKK